MCVSPLAPFLLLLCRVLVARGERLLGQADGAGGLRRGLQQGSEHSGAGTWRGEGLGQGRFARGFWGLSHVG